MVYWGSGMRVVGMFRVFARITGGMSDGVTYEGLPPPLPFMMMVPPWAFLEGVATAIDIRPTMTTATAWGFEGRR